MAVFPDRGEELPIFLEMESRSSRAAVSVAGKRLKSKTT